MFYNIGYITKVNLASLNGTEGSGGNITAIKKVSDSSGEEFVYVSGQALRRYLKETLLQFGEKISFVNDKGNPTIKDELGKELDLNKKLDDKLKEKIFKEVCDLDLFGYMLPKGDRRWSPIKVTPMMSILPYKGEYDYLTRKQAKDEGKGGNIVQVEIDTLNFMRGNILINKNHIGKDVNEFDYSETQILSDEEIKNRINNLIDAIKFFNGGAKQSRNLEDISPKFVIAIKQKSGNPFLLNALSVDKEKNLKIDSLIEAIEENMEVIESIKVGVLSGIFANEDEIREKFNKYEITTVNKALDSLKV